MARALVVAVRAARPGAWAAELLAMARAPAWSRLVPPVPVRGRLSCSPWPEPPRGRGPCRPCRLVGGCLCLALPICRWVCWICSGMAFGHYSNSPWS